MRYRVVSKSGWFWIEKFVEPKWYRRGGWEWVKEYDSDYEPILWVKKEPAVEYMESLTEKLIVVCERASK